MMRRVMWASGRILATIAAPTADMGTTIAKTARSLRPLKPVTLEMCSGR